MTQPTTNAQQQLIDERTTLELLRYLIDIGLVRYEPSSDIHHLRFVITERGKDYLNHADYRQST
jgi:DNA-binding IclR family transcriptional regulator